MRIPPGSIMNSAPNDTPPEGPTQGGPGNQSPRRGFGVVEWAILLGLAGLIIYGQFFGGPC